MSEIIRYTAGRSDLGEVLIARSDSGLVAVDFGGTAARLQQGFPQAQLVEDPEGLAALATKVIRQIEQPRSAEALPLDLRGSEFEQRVWQQLCAVPAGSTVSYGEIAARLQLPRLAREVGAACAANRLAVVVPCHRVLKKDGSLSGYRWGVARKRALLQRERLLAEAMPV